MPSHSTRYYLRSSAIYRWPGRLVLLAVFFGITATCAGQNFKVMTLNVAHGRRDKAHQVMLKKATIESHLNDIAKVLSRESPHVVALQEADGPSIWSGRFDHVEYLANGGNFDHRFRGEHVNTLNLSYGTALLSRLPLSESASRTFAPSRPTPRKGYVISTVDWPGAHVQAVDVVSLHLDFSRSSVRQGQLRELAKMLAERNNPRIMMGDFNCEFDGDEPTLKKLCEQVNVRAYDTAAKGQATFAKGKRRIDWVLISPQLEFVNYKTLEDTLSDHRAVVTELRLKRP